MGPRKEERKERKEMVKSRAGENGVWKSEMKQEKEGTFSKERNIKNITI